MIKICVRQSLYLLIISYLLLLKTSTLAQDKSLSTVPIDMERRLALVIGNQQYNQSHLDLKKIYNDVEDMKTALERLGFKVILKKDLNASKLIQSIDEFGRQLQNYDVGVFYYSGHGTQYKGEGYLVPTDAQIEYESEIESTCIPIARLYNTMEGSRVRTNLIFLDACRTNPKPPYTGAMGVPVQKGLPVPQNPSGSFVAYATRPGGTAWENSNGRNSYFTQELLKNLEIPGLSIRRILDLTTKGVLQQTAGKQQPGRYDELTDDFFFQHIPNFELNRVNVNVESIKSNKRSSAEEGYRIFNKVDRNKGLILLIKAANQNDTKAQLYLGEIYESGLQVKQDYVEAVRWYRKAANQNEPKGQINLGWMYKSGFGVEQDYKEARIWYGKAAEQGDPVGQNYMGILYESGLGVKQDYIEAIRWYRKAANQNEPKGQINLGMMYENGKGTSKDYGEALMYYRKAADQGDTEGQIKLGRMYEYGQGVSKNSNEALKWYRKAAEQGDVFWQMKLGEMYENGQGVPQNYVEASNWYHKAADQGDAKGQAYLGFMYEYGKGINQDYEEASKWYQKAADQGSDLGQAWLADIYENGKGVNYNLAKAIELYRLAAKQGNEDAQTALRRLKETW